MIVRHINVSNHVNKMHMYLQMWVILNETYNLKTYAWCSQWIPVDEPALASIMTHDHAKSLCASELGLLRI